MGLTQCDDGILPPHRHLSLFFPICHFLCLLHLEGTALKSLPVNVMLRFLAVKYWRIFRILLVTGSRCQMFCWDISDYSCRHQT